MENNRISLSMKEVDQQTGEDLGSNELSDSNADMGRKRRGNMFDEDVMAKKDRDAPWMNPERETNKSKKEAVAQSARSRVRLSTPERWELQQMKGAGVINHVDMPDFDQETVCDLV